MTYELIKVRIISFGWECLSFFGTALIAALASPEFSAIITAHFGETILGSLVLLAVSGLVKHLRNMRALAVAGRRFGSSRALEEVTLI